MPDLHADHDVRFEIKDAKKKKKNHKTYISLVSALSPM